MKCFYNMRKFRYYNTNICMNLADIRINGTVEINNIQLKRDAKGNKKKIYIFKLFIIISKHIYLIYIM